MAPPEVDRHPAVAVHTKATITKALQAVQAWRAFKR
jgi:hypothetical protein